MSTFALPTGSPPLAAGAADDHNQHQDVLQSQPPQHAQHVHHVSGDSSHHEQHVYQSNSAQQHQTQAYSSITQHGGLASPISQATVTSMAATAHHGLQALQAATGMPGTAPGSHVMTAQYPSVPSLASPVVDASYGSVDSGASSHGPLMQQDQHQQQHQPQHLPPSQPKPKARGTQKATRLRKACDLCSSRKVKCDEAGPPCKPCRDLGVECTFNRVAKRRGPPNRHAEAAKKARLEPAIQPQQQQTAQSSLHLNHQQPGVQQQTEQPVLHANHQSLQQQTEKPVLHPTHGPLQQQTEQPVLHLNYHPAGHYGAEPNVGPTSQTAAQNMMPMAGNESHGAFFGLGAEAIAPEAVLVDLVDAFFTYIYPLTPFPHEPTFRASFAARQDRTDPEFLALLSSMIGCLVASFPRVARTHLKNHRNANIANLFPRAIYMIERCREVALAARGSNFLAEKDINVYDAATSYFLGLAAGYTLQWKICRRFMAETMTFIRELGYHKQPDLGSSMHGVTYRGPSFDHIQDQLGKRLFWVMFLGVRSMHQLGVPIQDIVFPPPTTSEPYPAYPVEVDDEYIVRSQILGQPEGTVSLLTGFNLACKVYMTMNPLVSLEISYGTSSMSWQNQRQMLSNCVQDVKDIIDGMPHELTLDIDAGPGTSDPDLFNNQGQPSILRRRLQYEIQKANIYVSQLATRSYFTERYFSLREMYHEPLRAQEAAQAAYAAMTGSSSSGDSDVKDGADAASNGPNDTQFDDMAIVERELIVKSLLIVLTSLPQVYMEPNGGSLINKIRQVASTLLNEVPEYKGPLARQAQDYLARFLGILTRLEKTGPANGGVGVGLAENRGFMTEQDEEEELRSWADLHDHQRRFHTQGWSLLMP